MRYFLGVDGGQSSTTAIVGDGNGRVVGFSRGGPCNHVGAAEAREKFLRTVGGAVGEAAAQAGLARPDFDAACLGFSGGPADKDALVREFLSAARLSVTHDALIALSGACAGEPGLIVIAGTGSIAFGRNSEDRVARAGGWGYVFGDEGGGFDIARQALRAALRAEEGWGPPTALLPMLLETTGAANANQLMHLFYTPDYPRSRVAAYSRLVDEAANNGDPVAAQLLDRAAHDLAGLAAAVRGQLFEGGQTARVSPIGGVYRSRRLLERFRLLVELEDGNLFGPPLHGPAAGALIEAYRLAGLHPKLENLPESEK